MRETVGALQARRNHFKLLSTLFLRTSVLSSIALVLFNSDSPMVGFGDVQKAPEAQLTGRQVLFGCLIAFCWHFSTCSVSPGSTLVGLDAANVVYIGFDRYNY